LSDFNKNGIFIDRFSTNTKVSNFMKIRPVGAKFVYADKRTDRQKDATMPLVAIRNFANTVKNGLSQ